MNQIHPTQIQPRHDNHTTTHNAADSITGNEEIIKIQQSTNAKQTNSNMNDVHKRNTVASSLHIEKDNDKKNYVQLHFILKYIECIG